jgi:hypothetical protein
MVTQKLLKRMANTTLLLIVFCAAIPAGFVLGQGKPPTWIPTPEERASQPWIPGPDELVIGRLGITMPLGRVLLARKRLEYCALKFTDTWLGETKNDHYTSYEFYCQGDGSGDFPKSTVVSGTGELFFPRIRSFLGLPFIKGAKDNIECGGMKFKWFYISGIDFHYTELAPTPWTSIADVNVYDPRIQWYREDKSRETKKIHIDRLWDNPRAGEGGGAK